MQNIDRKVILILNLNKKVKRKSLLQTNIQEAINIPALSGYVREYEKVLNKLTIIEKVLVNTNYLNY